MTSRVAALALATVLLLACNGGNAMGFEREDEVSGVAEGLHEVWGGSLGDAKHHRRTEPGCQAREDIEDLDDAWYERNRFSIVSTGKTLAQLTSLAIDHLEAEGFTVERLRAPISGTTGLRAVRDDLAMILEFGDTEPASDADRGGDGRNLGANFLVTAGPCAISLSGIPDYFELDE